MKLSIDFDAPIIKCGQELQITTVDIDDFYTASSNDDKSNLFFVLLASLHYYEENGDLVKAAHFSFLLAYYVFSPLTPPASQELALHYIRKAISLNDIFEYHKWLVVMENGN